MTDPRPDILAARLLVQWGRTRQTAWHDPSRDLLAALGNRHASFSDFSDHVPDAPPPSDRRAAPPTAPSTTVETALPSSTVAAGPPAVPAAVTPLPDDPTSTAPVAPTIAAGPPSSYGVAPAPVVAPPVTASPSRGRRPLRPGALALAAALVLAVMAVPAVWRSFSTSRVSVAPSPSRVMIDSNPPGSVVLIDNVERGKTPLALELPAGTYRVQLRHRKNVRNFDLEVVAGMPAEATVDWTKKPVIKKKVAPQKSAGTKTATVASPPTTTAQAAPEREPTHAQEASSQEAPSSEASPSETAPSPEQPADPETPR